MRLIRPKDVAVMLNISTKTVSRMALEGSIPALRIGGQWRFYEEEIVKWVNEQATIEVDPRTMRAHRVTREDRKSKWF